MKKIILFIAILFLGIYSGYSQKQLNKYQYWFDNNFTNVVTISISPQDSLQLLSNINASGLLQGLHVLNFRFIDNTGSWSAVSSRFFFINSTVSLVGQKNINSYEYWFDNNFNNRITQNISLQDSITFISSINTNSLISGLHVFHFRCKDNLNYWSSVASTFFFINPTSISVGQKLITTTEYWFDNSYNNKITQSISGQSFIQILNSYNTDSLQTGLHVFHFRSKDNSGYWSSVFSQFFIKNKSNNVFVNDLLQYRYWLNQQTTFTYINFTGLQDTVFVPQFNLSNVLNGRYALHFQIKDIRNIWSSTITDSITVQQVPQPAGQITGLVQGCQQTDKVLYSVQPILNATSYIWTLPNGVSGSSNTNSILVSFDSTTVTGNITVYGHNAFGDGLSSSLAISVNRLPFNAGTISGLTTVCQGQNNVTYIVPSITNATSYIWTLPSGCTGSSTSDTINVNYGSSAISGTITVKGVNTCGNGDTSSISITVNQVPSTPIISVQNNCGNSVLSTTATGNLLWSFNNATTSQITVANSGTYTVTTTVNGCVSSAGSHIAAPISIPSTPIISVDNSCGSSILSTTKNGTLLWNTGDTTSQITVANPGIYTLTSTINGCTSSAGSQTAAPIALPTAPTVTVQNNCGKSILSTTATGTLLWSTEATTSNISVANPGIYTVTTTVNGCTSAADTGIASPLFVPLAPTVGVQNNCGNSVLSTTATGILLWSYNNATTSQITVTNPGMYFVTTTLNGCTSIAGSGTAAPTSINTETLSISATPGTTLIYGSTATFTASPTGIVLANDVKWYVNNNLQSNSGFTFNYIPTNGDTIQAKIIASGCNTGANSNKLGIIVNYVMPSAAGTITGANPVCQGQTGVIYRVAPIANATSYSWTLPSGATGSSSSDSIILNFSNNAISDSIKVQGTNPLGSGLASALKIIVNPLPSAAGIISGDSVVCQGIYNITHEVTYTVQPILNATSYTWTLPYGTSGSSTTNSITVTYGSSALSGYVSVSGHNSCGNGVPSAKAITVNPLPNAGAISGLSSVCLGQNNIVYTIPSIPNASYYIWTLPNGASGSSYSDSIIVDFTNASSGNITVNGANACGNGTISTLGVVVNTPSIKPKGIGGTISSCIGTNSTLSIIEGSLGVGATWKWYADSCGGTPIGTGSSISIIPVLNKTYYVRAEGVCDTTLCAHRTITEVVNHPPTLTFTNNTGFVNDIVNPISGTPTDDYRFEVRYTSADGHLPSITYPRLQLDFEGNGIYTDANDKQFFMTVVNPDITDVTNGKDYYIITTLPISQTWKSLISVVDQAGCSATFGPFSEPKVLQAADISIFANDISFSNSHPNPGDNITVYATIHNYSGSDANNFVVHLVNQFDTTAHYNDLTIAHLGAYTSTTVSWVIQTPDVPAWCPMQVFIDWTNVLIEPNELDNQAIRPFTNGNYTLPGKIVITANASPFNVPQNSTFSVCGNAYYIGTAVQLADSSCSGATVTYAIAETGQTGSTNTNSLGNYCFSINASLPLGLYHINLHVTDYTLNGDTTTSFQIVPQVITTCPDLITSINIGPQTVNPGYSHQNNCVNILQGQTLSGTITVTNQGTALSDTSVLYINCPQGVPSPPSTVNVPALEPGASFVYNLPVMTFNTVGGTYISTIADYNNTVSECNENNNGNSECIMIQPILSDIGVYGSMGQYNNECQFSSITVELDNSGGVSTGAFDNYLKIYKDTTLITTLYEPSNGLPALSTENITFNWPAPHPTGNYSFVFQADYLNVITESNKTNNSIILSTILNPCKADLSVYNCSNLKVNPVDPQTSGNITVYATIVNYGLISASNFNVDFNIAGTDNIYPFTGILASGQSQIISVTVPTPTYGNDLLTVTVDPNNVIDESNENNNTVTASLCWDFYLSDICGGGAFWDHSQVKNNPVLLNVGVNNSGIYNASNLVIKYEVSGPGLTGWVNLGNATTACGSTSCGGCPFTVSLPGAFAFPQSGTYQVRMTADPDNNYIECNESNNVLVVNVTVTDLPDYEELSQFIAPSKLNPDLGEPINIDITYENIGMSTTDSLNLFTQVDDTPLETIRVPGLVSGTFSTVHLTQNWSSSLRGIHIIRTYIDYNNEIVESNELNNEASRAIIVGKAPNLRFMAFSVNDSVPLFGSTISIFSTIKNVGYDSCNANLNLYYLDNNNNEILIGQKNFTLDTSASINITIPWVVANVHTTIFGRITNGVPAEYDLTDNNDSLQIGGAINLSFTSTPASCHTSNDGKAKVIIAGGQQPYTIEWSYGGENADSLTAAAGTYHVTVTDINGLTATGIVTITSPPLVHVSINITPSSNPVCSNIMETFTATTVNGGTPPIFIWQKNGVAVGGDSTLATYSFMPSNGDSISCVLLSNATCADHYFLNSNSVIMNVLQYPLAAEGISGSSTVCQKQSGVVYQTPLINALFYQWTLPSGAIGNSTTNSITVSFDSIATSGYITVKGINTCGIGDSSSLWIDVNALPSQPGAITGPTDLYRSENGLSYSIPHIVNATSYIWTYPNGMSTIDTTVFQFNGEGAYPITTFVHTDEHAISGLITVAGQNSCGIGHKVELYVKVFYIKKLQLNAMLQEYYNRGTGLMNQTQGIDWNSGNLLNNFSDNIVDTLTILLRKTNINDPNPCTIDTAFYSQNLITDGSIPTIPPIPSSITGFHYIVVIHRNSIETWSDSVDFSPDTIIYNFHTHITQFALDGGMYIDGSNLAYIWGGDVNQNGNLESEDATQIYVAALSIDETVNNGYVINDVDGNGNIDSQDYGLAYSNALLGANIINPFSYLNKK